MRKIEKLKAALKNLLIEFRSVNTDKAVLVWDGEEDLQEGFAVYIVDEEGNRNIPEDGEYVGEDKITYVVENGTIKEIVPAPDEQPEEQPEAPAEEPVEETPEEPAEEPVEEQPVEEPAEEEPVKEPAEEPVEEPVEETPVEEVEEVAEEANELADQVQALEEKVNALVEEIEQLKAFKATVEAMSAGKPAQQQFREASIDPNRSNNKELANLQKLFN
jgi:outer membrane biosynthesis protein TonB